MSRLIISFTTTILLVFVNTKAIVRISHHTGVGTRAYSMANNYVALSNDLTAVYWNPAGLAFMPVREFQISLFGQSQRSEATFFDSVEVDYMPRLHIMHGGLVHALPTSRGGFTLAGAYQNPILFDDINTFSGTYEDTTIASEYRSFGGLNFWSAAFGIQIAPGAGVGASISLITGRENTRDKFSKNPTDIDGNFDDDIETGYLGYDIRAGFLYSYQDKVFIGIRLVLPQRIRFREEFSEGYPDNTGKFYSSYNAAVGYGMELPFMTISTEINMRAPYTFIFPSEKIPTNSPASRTKISGGIGVEVPTFLKSTMFRAGYSFNEFDTHTYLVKYSDQPFSETWSSDGISAEKDKHLVTVGLGYLYANWNFELAYGYQFWELNTRNTLHQEFNLHRLLLSFSMRY